MPTEGRLPWPRQDKNYDYLNFDAGGITVAAREDPVSWSAPFSLVRCVNPYGLSGSGLGFLPSNASGKNNGRCGRQQPRRRYCINVGFLPTDRPVILRHSSQRDVSGRTIHQIFIRKGHEMPRCTRTSGLRVCRKRGNEGNDSSNAELLCRACSLKSPDARKPAPDFDDQTTVQAWIRAGSQCECTRTDRCH